MLEITIGNCYKCDLETINDPNNSQYFWINRRDLEIETKRNWQVIFDKYKDLSTQKYRRELTPNITFQPNKIFVRNDLFEKVIKSCKATNLEFLKLKENFCLYEDICDKKEFILMSEKRFIQHDAENKELKEENKKLNENENENENGNENDNENENENVNANENEKENKTIKDSNIQKLIEELKEIKSVNWLDKYKFKEILTIIDSNKFGHKNKIGDFKYIDIKDLVDNIRNNTISEIAAKKRLNRLKIIITSEIKHKRLIHGQKELLSLFDLLDTISTNKALESQENEKVKSRKEEN